MKSKKPMAGLFRDNPETSEGKYLVKRRDGTVPEWPNFVLGGADPFAEVALREYAKAVSSLVIHNPKEAEKMGVSLLFACRINELADEFREWREKNGQGDPGMGRHRNDDPATIEEMKRGRSA